MRPSPLALTACALALSLSGCAVVPSILSRAGDEPSTKLQHAMDELAVEDIGGWTVGYADVDRIRIVFGAYPPAEDSPAHAAWELAAIGMPRAMRPGAPESAFTAAADAFRDQTVWTASVWQSESNNSSHSAGAGPVFQEMLPNLPPRYRVTGDDAINTYAAGEADRAYPAQVSREGADLATLSTRGEGPTDQARRARPLADCLGQVDVAALRVTKERRPRVGDALGITLESPGSIPAAYCIVVAEGEDAEVIANDLRGHRGRHYDAGEVVVKDRLVHVTLVPHGDPVAAAAAAARDHDTADFPGF